MNDALHIPDPETQPEFYADVPLKRLLAWLVDTGLTLILCILVLPFTAFTGVFFFPFLFLSLGLLYRTATLSQGSATWGMRLFAIEFRTLSGQRLDPVLAFWHTLGFTMSCVFALAQVASILLMLTGTRGQGLTDIALGTVALNRRAAT